MKKQWQTREYREGDEKAILDLYKIVFGSEMSLKHWLWKCRNNPAGQPFIILAEAEGRIVGQFALLPRLMKLGDKVGLGVLSVDTMVHPEYRGQGMHVVLGKKTCELAAQRGSQLAYGFSNQLSHRNATTKIGFTGIYEGGIPLWVKPLDMESILKKRFTSNAALAKLGGAAARVSISLLRRQPKRKPACSVKEFEQFDERVDRLAEAFSRDYNIMVMRDRSYLTWRHRQKPGEKYTILAAEKEGDLTGIIILKCAEEAGLKVGFTVDLVSKPSVPGAAAELIAAAVEHFKSKQMDIAGCMMLPGSSYCHTLKEMGFIKTPKWLLPQEMYLDVNAQISQHPAEFLLDPKNWYVTWSDHDVI